MIGDIPTIHDAGHAHTIYGLGNLGQAQVVAGTTTGTWSAGGLNQFQQAAAVPTYAGDFTVVAATPDTFAQRLKPKKETAMADKPTRRFVQVFIADTDDNVPLESSLLYSGTPKLTDATDQELYFEIDLKAILAAHNEKRVTWLNKKVKDRMEYLEPARIRELKMVVVNIASF